MTHYIRKDKYTIEEVLSKVTYNKKTKVDFDGDLIKMNSQRYVLFKLKGCICVKCKLEGTFFYKETTKGNEHSYHFNLYGINENGEEILFTKDHIIPKSKGGLDLISNYDVMCLICNHEKGSNENF